MGVQVEVVPADFRIGQERQLEAALAQYDRMLAANPNDIGALGNRGNVLHAMKRYVEAIAGYDRVLAIAPDHVAALNNRGNSLQELLRYAEAMACYDRAIGVQPGYAEAHNNRGNALFKLRRYPEALASYERALSLKGDFAEPFNGRGMVFQAERRNEEALASYGRAIALKPDYGMAHFNESLCLLLMGDYERGWERYEWRWRSGAPEFARATLPQPLWLGDRDIRGKTLLLHAEQGLGDTLQFCRYVPMVAAQGARVVLLVQAPLKKLLSEFPGADEVLGYGDPLPAFDFQCPLMSLPLAFKTRLATVPAATPYLRSATAAKATWRKILGSKKAPRIGLAWSGNPANRINPFRSIPLHRLKALAERGAQWVSLQKEVRAEEEAMLKAARISHYGPQLVDFEDTAALISNLDLVISVETGVAHLAGALGKPVWILLPYTADWRWLLDREDSPWYPTARLFRQAGIGDWDSVIERVSAELKIAFPRAFP